MKWEIKRNWKDLLTKDLTLTEWMEWIKQSKRLSALDGSTLQKPQVSPDEIERLYQLLEKGMKIDDCVQLALDHPQEVLANLQKGATLFQALFYQGNSELKQLGGLCEFMDFKDAIRIHQKLMTLSKGLFVKIGKDLIYPLTLLFFSYGLLSFFSGSVMPSLEMYGIEGYQWLVWCIQTALETLFMVGIIGVGIGLLCQINISFRMRISKHLSLFRLWNGALFGKIFGELCHCSLPTNVILQKIQKLSGYGTASYIAKDWSEWIQQGKSLEECAKSCFYIEEQFSLFLSQGIQLDTLPDLLDSYYEMTLKKIQKKLKSFLHWTQITSYITVACTAFCVYQMMLVPLNMLETF